MDTTDEVLDPARIMNASIAEQINFWEAMCGNRNKFLDDLLVIAFMKHRNSRQIKIATPHLTKYVTENEDYVQLTLREVWQDSWYTPHIFQRAYALTCWFKFDNIDRNKMFDSKPRGRTHQDKNFDYDNRHTVLKAVLGRNSPDDANISFYAYISLLQFIATYDESQSCDINTLIKTNLIHYSELCLINNINNHIE